MATAPELGQLGVIQVGVWDHDGGTTGQSGIPHRRRNNDAGRLAFRQRRSIARVAQKTKLAGLGAVQWSQALHSNLGVSQQFATYGFYDVPKPERKHG
jgi:hypothetical protein